MLQLLIADDEQDTRSVIREMIPWEENGIYVCGEASNGKQAIQLTEDLHPDIALLDICMPLLDGIKVAQYTSEQRLDMENIILSGHDEFSYAQQAIKYGVSDYLLKPCKPEEILSAILRCRERLIERRQKENLLTNMSGRLSEDKRALHEHALTQWLSGHEVDPQLSALFFNEDHAHCAVASFAPQSNVIQQMTARDLILQTLAQDFPICEAVDMEGRIVVLVRLPRQQAQPLYTACLHVWERFSLENQAISIGVGKAVSTSAQVVHSYRSSSWILECQFFTQQNSVRLDTQEIDPEQFQYLALLDRKKLCWMLSAPVQQNKFPAYARNFSSSFKRDLAPKPILLTKAYRFCWKFIKFAKPAGFNRPVKWGVIFYTSSLICSPPLPRCKKI